MWTVSHNDPKILTQTKLPIPLPIKWSKMVGPKKTKLRTFYGSPSSRFGAVNSKLMAIALLGKFKISLSVECVS